MTEPFEIEFEERPGYLYAHVRSETIDPDSATSYLSMVAERCAESKCRRLMMVRDIPVILPDIDLFFAAQGFLEKLRGRKVAIVNPHPSIDDEVKFAVMISTNRGGNFSFHQCPEDAEKWLLGE